MRLARALAPLQPLYSMALAAKDLAYAHGLAQPRTLTRPVVSIGNLSTGGAGKTPVVIELARLLAERGMRVDVLSRGYGRRSQQAIERVDIEGIARRFGDEPLLIARATGQPVYVGASRFAAGLLAEQDAGNPAALHLLDDGFQHRRLARTVDIVVLHPADASDHLLPAGRLRERLTAMRRADFLLLREDDAVSVAALQQAQSSKPIWRLRRTLLPPPRVQGQAFAFCGIAHPEEFFAALRRQGTELHGTLTFRDHHPFVLRDMDLIAQRACGAAVLLTTEKDMVRLSPAQRARLAHVAPLHAVPLQVRIVNENSFVAALLAMLAERPLAPARTAGARAFLP